MGRMAYMILGFSSMGLGTLGLFLPLLPTTVFLLIAAWAFARSSTYWHQWLLQHRHFGPLIRCWQEHHSMPRRAKTIAFLMLAVSYLFTALLLGPLSLGALISGLCIAGVAIYLAHIPVLTPHQVQSSACHSKQ